ncbi:hypothetical protein [Paenibacillus herberti]|uniref:AAA domain-containing protein n=1 Tax=Paenibacillus herberti TaxID=1619309 RepID=A0A229P0S3_9BACL|nr:hypothetical protein [Paenibacillus herberti]OXM15544.1 hypothetical protein CGZ75_02055 [Paenibacillus herberti]
MLIIFWSPFEGQSRSTTNMAAVASTLALDYHMRILLTQSSEKNGDLERWLLKSDRAGEQRGLDAVHRLFSCGMFSSEGLRDHAEPILRERLDLLASRNLTEDQIQELMPHILEGYRRFYDLLFVDLSACTGSELRSYLLDKADVIVTSVNQNRLLLDRYFNDIRRELPSGKSVLSCIGSYERGSKLHKDRIMRQYGISKKEIGAVPRNVRLMDAQNEGQLMTYLMRAREAKGKFLEFSEEAEFTKSLRHLGGMLLQALELYPASDLEAGDD